jgi:hypothetical protein
MSAVAWLVGVSLIGGLPSSHTTADTGCTLRTRIVIVNLPNREDGPVLRHAWDAVRAGQPEILHIDREDAQAHRRASLRGIPAKPGYDRDEYPVAASVEGGAGADVRYIDPHANRSAGAIMQHQLEPFCDGQAFRYERRPGPKPR